MGRFRRRLKKIAKKVGRVMGGPVTKIVDAGRKVKNEKGAKNRTKAFFKGMMGGGKPSIKDTIKEIHDLNATVTDEIIDAAGVKPKRRVVFDVFRNTGSLPNVVKPEAIITNEAKLAVQSAKNVLNGNFKQAGRDLLKGLGLPLSMTGDEFALWLGVNYSAAASSLGLEQGSQPIPEDLIDYLKKVFGNALNYSDIRIKRGETLISKSNGGRALVLGNLILLVNNGIYSTGTSSEGYLKPGGVLLHELIHVWQYQNGGPSYMSDAIVWQIASSNAYNWRSRIRNGWANLNPEAQAAFIEAAFNANAFDPIVSGLLFGNFTSGGVNYSSETRSALEQIKTGRIKV